MITVLVANLHGGPVRGRKGQRRADAVSLEVDVVPEAVGVLIHAVQAKRDVRGGPAEVGRESSVSVAAALKHDLADGLEDGVLGDAVDHAAAPAAPEDHRVGPFQRFNTIEVVEVAVVLHVVPDAVDEEICRRALAANNQLIAVVLALVGHDPRHIADNVGHAGHQLVAHQLLRDDRDRLGHVAEGGWRLGGAGDRRDAVAARSGGHRNAVLDPGDLERESTWQS